MKDTDRSAPTRNRGSSKKGKNNNWLTDSGREWLDNDGNFKFGKYGPPNAKSVESVAENDPSYLRWVLENCGDDMYHEDRDIIETALEFARRGRG